MSRPALHTICTVPDCGRPHVARGFCSRHYQLWYQRNRDSVKSPGRGPAICIVGGCDRPAQSRGWCHAHYTRWHNYGTVADARGALALRRQRHRSIFKEDPSYVAAHRRVANVRGIAGGYACEECGEQATDWAYIEGSPGERWEIAKRRPFGVDPFAYRPLCRSCHQSEHRRTSVCV